MNVYETIMNRRSIRKFRQEPIPKDDLIKLVDCARMAAYPMNLQPLKFTILDDPADLGQLFPCTRWAGYLENGTPKENERPTAYILMLGDTTIKANSDFQVETGAAGATITLAAAEAGVASCWLGAINREKIRELFGIPEQLTVLDLIALGYPAQESKAVPMKGGDFKYYMKETTLQVPKRSLDEVLLQR
ncbi:MAG: nitroreductase family protein [Clostridia bacterium]|nr:nitroreductase family protein [Clostridia bacterium]